MAPPALDVVDSPREIPYYSRNLRERYQLREEEAHPAKPQLALPEAPCFYYPDLEAHLKRTKAAALSTGIPGSLPAGWPSSIKGPEVWTGADFNDESTFVMQLDEADLLEIQSALRHFLTLGLDGSEVIEERFPLSGLKDRLHRVRDMVYEGHGFAIIRGLDVDQFSSEDLVIVTLGLTSYIASKRGMQDQRGSMLMHVQSRDDEDRTRNSVADMPFHTDTVCDCICLLTKSCSSLGGESVLASIGSVYNALAATRPDIIHTLARPDWVFDTLGRSPPSITRPLMYLENGKLFLNFSRRLLCGNPSFPRTRGLPVLSKSQLEALDVVHFLAREHQLVTSMKRGDIRLLNNMTILHRRERFHDSEDNRRHLMRLWLHNETLCPKLPVPLRLAWDRVFYDTDREEHWDIEPIVHNGKILRVAASCD